MVGLGSCVQVGILILVKQDYAIFVICLKE